jgi:regulator of protease activity HflC (stomatin/prohibitin superfamily)
VRSGTRFANGVGMAVNRVALRREDTSVEAQRRERAGWRAGRPVEDPAKTKRWGFVTAKPSEFLVHCRRGRVLRTSGQGATCFKWPWDSVAVVPTSFQKVGFVADQITLERVGVGISGLAVYRIAEPLLAYRVLNFSYPERAQEKLEQTLTEMLMGATRRLVANLTVDECLQKRKAALADELLRELAPVLGGAGRPQDGTDRGWGVVLDTVEIQEVRILSERVFDAMQAPFRAALDRQSREARAEAEKRSALAEAAARRDVHEATIEAEASVRARQAEVALREEESRSREAQRRIELAFETERARATRAPARRCSPARRSRRSRPTRRWCAPASWRWRALASSGSPRTSAGAPPGSSTSRSAAPRPRWRAPAPRPRPSPPPPALASRSPTSSPSSPPPSAPASARSRSPRSAPATAPSAPSPRPSPPSSPSPATSRDV